MNKVLVLFINDSPEMAYPPLTESEQSAVIREKKAELRKQAEASCGRPTGKPEDKNRDIAVQRNIETFMNVRYVRFHEVDFTQYVSTAVPQQPA